MTWADLACSCDDSSPADPGAYLSLSFQHNSLCCPQALEPVALPEIDELIIQGSLYYFGVRDVLRNDETRGLSSQEDRFTDPWIPSAFAQHNRTISPAPSSKCKPNEGPAVKANCSLRETG